MKTKMDLFVITKSWDNDPYSKKYARWNNASMEDVKKMSNKWLTGVRIFKYDDDGEVDPNAVLEIFYKGQNIDS